MFEFQGHILYRFENNTENLLYSSIFMTMLCHFSLIFCNKLFRDYLLNNVIQQNNSIP